MRFYGTRGETSRELQHYNYQLNDLLIIEFKKCEKSLAFLTYEVTILPSKMTMEVESDH